MTVSEKISWIESAFNLESGSLDPSKRFDEIKGHDDPLARQTLIAIMEGECELLLTDEQIDNFVTVQDIIDFMGYP